ncbi:MAG: SRPBCC family protein [Candidatus Cybelea sp.]
MTSFAAKYHLELSTPNELEIVMTRVFDAPASLLFDAFTKPELIRRWLLGPDGWTMPVCELDLRTGGSFHYQWRNEADRNEFGLHGIYREIVPGKRIVHVENFDEPWYPDDSIATTEFVEGDGITTLTMTMRFVSREGRDVALESGMEKGVAASYDRLEQLLGEG